MMTLDKKREELNPRGPYTVHVSHRYEYNRVSEPEELRWWVCGEWVWGELEYGTTLTVDNWYLEI